MSLYHTKLWVTITCKLSGRISESVPVRQDMTVKKGAETTHTTAPAMQFVRHWLLFFTLIKLVV